MGLKTRLAVVLALGTVGAIGGYAALSQASPGFSAAAARAAIADPKRPPADRALDAARHPLAILELAAVKPGAKVFELIPGTGYFTRLFSRLAGPTGRVYAVWPEQYARFSVGKVEALKALAQSPGYANLTVEVQPTPAIAAPEPLDLVFTSQNYHDYPDEFMGKVDPMVLNRAAFRLLKSGGAYVIIDHKAAEGSGVRDTEALHRIDPVIVRQQVESAGFRFHREIKVLENPADPLDIKVFDPKIRGRTSQFAYRFVKP